MIRWFTVTVLALVPLAASAIPVEVTAEGIVTSSVDDFNHFGLGVGAGTIVGATITATWIFDSADAPADQDASPAIAQHDDPTGSIDWLDARIDIDTPTIDTSIAEDIVTSPDLHNDRIEIWDNSLGRDRYEISALSFTDLDVGFIRFISTAIIARDIVDDLITSLDLSQSVDLMSMPGDTTAGSFDYANGDFNEFGGVAFASAHYDVTSITVRAVTTVPEPSMLSLFAAGLLAFGLGFGWRKH